MLEPANFGISAVQCGLGEWLLSAHSFRRGRNQEGRLMAAPTSVAEAPKKPLPTEGRPHRVYEQSSHAIRLDCPESLRSNTRYVHAALAMRWRGVRRCGAV
jgi:hypothetical protein